MTSRYVAIGCLLGLALRSRAAVAQPVKSETFTLSGGVTTPISDSRHDRVSGGHVQVGLALRMQSALSSRFQFEAALHSLDDRASPFRRLSNPRVWVVTASVARDIGAFREFRPYIIAGVGTTSIDEQGRRELHLNFAAGAGVVMPAIGRLRPFVEGRYLRVMTAAANKFVPVSFGIAF
jgi:opacity protein-like surface antigen